MLRRSGVTAAALVVPLALGLAAPATADDAPVPPGDTPVGTAPTTSPDPAAPPSTSPAPEPPVDVSTPPTDPSTPPDPAQPSDPVTPPVEEEQPSTELQVERSLSALGLPTGPVDGRYTRATRRALCAFRDLNGLTATRKLPNRVLGEVIVDAQRLPRLPRKLRSVRALVSLTCQATYVATRRGTVLRVLPVSTGKDAGPHETRRGFKRVYYKVNRWQASSLFPEPDGRPGLYRPVYFDRGIAFHGVRSPIRTRPQSHGCVRTWPEDQDWLYSRLNVRDQVFVYGDYWRGRSAPLGGYGR